MEVALELNNTWRLEEFYVHARKDLYNHEKNFKGNSGDISERKEESCTQDVPSA